MKEQKPLSSKKPPKPPKPNVNHQIIEEWIANAKPALNPIVSELDNLILQELKNPRFAIGSITVLNSSVGVLSLWLMTFLSTSSFSMAVTSMIRQSLGMKHVM